VKDEFRALCSIVKNGKVSKEIKASIQKRSDAIKDQPDDMANLKYWLTFFDKMSRAEDYVVYSIDSSILQSLDMNEGFVTDAYSETEGVRDSIEAEYHAGILNETDPRVQNILWKRRRMAYPSDTSFYDD